MHELRGAPMLVAVLLLLCSCSCSCSASSTSPATDGEALMQQLSRADLVRLAGYGEERLSSVLVTGTLLCDACLRLGSHLRTSHVPVLANNCRKVFGTRPMMLLMGLASKVAVASSVRYRTNMRYKSLNIKRRGAKVAVACKTAGQRRRSRANWAEGTTDEYGEFIIDLPSHLHAIPRLEEDCAVRILRVPKNSPCRRIWGTNRVAGIKLSSIGNSIRVYTAGSVRLRHTSRQCLRSRHGETSHWIRAELS